jgi:hypothetical protein
MDKINLDLKPGNPFKNVFIVLSQVSEYGDQYGEQTYSQR